MAQELIPILTDTLEGEDIPTVNAKDLHSFLEADTRFNDWIVRRIEEYGFIEEQDFYSILSKTTGGRPAKDYHLTLDMAKELAMVERNEKGRQARQYFIAAEKRLKETTKALPPPAAEPQQALQQTATDRLIIWRSWLTDEQIINVQWPAIFDGTAKFNHEAITMITKAFNSRTGVDLINGMAKLSPVLNIISSWQLLKKSKTNR